MLRIALFGAALSAAPTWAANRVLLETPVTYAAGAGVVPKVREECRLEDMLAGHVSKVLAARNGGDDGTLAPDANPNGAAVLRVKITHVLGVGGGAWSGPKSMTVSAELLENNKPVRQVSLNRATTGGAFGGFKGTCSILERSAVALAKDLGRWAYDARVQLRDNEEAPKDGNNKEGTEQK